MRTLEDRSAEAIRVAGAPSRRGRAVAAGDLTEKLLHDHGDCAVRAFPRNSEQMRGRFEGPAKLWKISPEDLKERELWDAYVEAYEIAPNRYSTPGVPRHVMPAEHKRFSSLVVAGISIGMLDSMNPATRTSPPTGAGFHRTESRNARGAAILLLPSSVLRKLIWQQLAYRAGCSLLGVYESDLAAGGLGRFAMERRCVYPGRARI